ncbi:hypothetical protein TSOC_003574 [Tetrabaena socialis]|uniref:DNA repair protein XRCC2 n=1 Tax=Tetrabaena socialis TaxID=47790 RepID=A0A2J8AB85_9CHLO|nr:hypothetical protein TSOC_003574 [Tetrabaena socialis]|eukprot:PNH09767.1 hypothetical protein TSOC_003574 [Tetrabaena socialis]
MEGALPPDLAAILAFDETGACFFRRVQQERVPTGLELIDRHVALRPGVLLEAAGPPGSGKSELLLAIALHVLQAPYQDPRAWLLAPPPPLQAPQGWRPAAAAHASGAAGDAQEAQQQLGRGCAGGQRGQEQGQQRGAQESGAASAVGPAPTPAGAGQVVLLDLDAKFDGVRMLQALARRYRLPVVATKTAAVTARGLEEGGGGGAGPELGAVRLEQREFMPMPWQNMVTHRMLLYPRGVVNKSAVPAAEAGQQRLMTRVLVEMLGAVGTAAAKSAAGGGTPGAAAGGGGATEGGGRAVQHLLISDSALVDEW